MIGINVHLQEGDTVIWDHDVLGYVKGTHGTVTSIDVRRRSVVVTLNPFGQQLSFIHIPISMFLNH